MPIPPIYVVEEDDGKYLLIDGLQRISSYLHLRGELEALHLETPVKKGDKLVLQDCDIVPELNGKTFDDLGTALQIRLKRAFVRVEVVRKGSNAHFKYHMFKRLNTGGATLSTQQIRNCTIRLLNPKFIDFIDDLSKEKKFRIILDNFEETGWRTPELLQEVQQTTGFYFDKLCQMKMPSWTKGRVALVGDAGYCASPAAGRGGSLAIDGAAALASAFEKCGGDYENAFEEYNQSFRPFIEEVQAGVVDFALDALMPRTEEAILKRNKEGFGF